MSYEPTNWKDRVVEKPRTFTMQQNPDGTITLVPAPGTVVQEGTPVNAANLNKLENGLVSHLAEIVQQAEPQKIPRAMADGKIDANWLPYDGTWEEISTVVITEPVAEVVFDNLSVEYSMFKVVLYGSTRTAIGVTVDNNTEYNTTKMVATTTVTSTRSEALPVIPLSTGNYGTFDGEINFINIGGLNALFSGDMKFQSSQKELDILSVVGNVTNKIAPINSIRFPSSLTPYLGFQNGTTLKLWGCK